MQLSNVPEQLELLSFPVILIDSDDVIYANGAAKRYFGRTDVEDMPANYFFDGLDPELWQKHPIIRRMTCFNANGVPMETTVVLFLCKCDGVEHKGIAIGNPM